MKEVEERGVARVERERIGREAEERKDGEKSEGGEKIGRAHV